MLQCVSEPPGWLRELRLPNCIPQVSDSVGQEQCSRICFPIGFPKAHMVLVDGRTIAVGGEWSYVTCFTGEGVTCSGVCRVKGSVRHLSNMWK
jgi:hypothetical protein